MTDRHYEPYLSIDPAAEERRLVPAEALPAPYPGEGVWVRTAPLPAGSFYLGPSGRRDRGAWLALIALAIGGSALYLAYASVVAPDLPARPVAAAPVAQLADPPSVQPPLPRGLVASSDVVPPPLPRAPTASPHLAPAPAAWTPAAVSTPHPTRLHRPAKPVRARAIAVRPARHQPRDTRHPLNWYAN